MVSTQPSQQTFPRPSKQPSANVAANFESHMKQLMANQPSTVRSLSNAAKSSHPQAMSYPGRPLPVSDQENKTQNVSRGTSSIRQAGRHRHKSSLKGIVYGISLISILSASALGYWININIPEHRPTYRLSDQLDKQTAPAISRADRLLNTIMAPADEKTAYANEESAVFNLLGMEKLQEADESLVTTGSGNELPFVEMAVAGSDPFQPVLNPKASSSISPDEPEKDALIVQFSGVIEDRKTRKKVAILKVQEPAGSGGTSSDSPVVTYIKKANESFDAFGRRIKLNAVGLNNVKLSIDGEPFNIMLNEYNTSDPGTAGSTAPANTMTPAGSNDATPPAPLVNGSNGVKVNRITPANVIKLDE